MPRTGVCGAIDTSTVGLVKGRGRKSHQLAAAPTKSDSTSKVKKMRLSSLITTLFQHIK
jgi:hypothetical protein